MSDEYVWELLKDLDLSFLLPNYDINEYHNLLKACEPFYVRTEKDILMNILEIFDDDSYMSESKILEMGKRIKMDREIESICKILGEKFIKKFLKKNK